MRVSRYHKLVEVINREIGMLNGNIGVRGYEMKKGVDKKENEKEKKRKYHHNQEVSPQRYLGLNIMLLQCMEEVTIVELIRVE